MKKLLPVWIAWALWLSMAPLARASAMRTVADVDGKPVAVPVNPQRIAALSEIDLDSCLALGLAPVGTINGRGQSTLPNYLIAADGGGVSARDIPIVGDIGRPNLELLITLKPDLILTAPSRPETLALLSKIAPTVVTFKNGDNWKDVFERVSTIVNQEAKAKEFMAGYERAIAAAKAKIGPTSGRTVSIVRWNPNGPAFMYQDSFASLVIRDMGFERPVAQKIAGQKHSMPISLEALHMIDADWMFIGTLKPRGEATDAMHEVSSSPSFQKLTSVKAKRYYAVDGSKWTSIGGPLAAMSIIKEASESMASRP